MIHAREDFNRIQDPVRGEHKKKFVLAYGNPQEMNESDTYRAYYHCKRVIKTYVDNNTIHEDGQRCTFNGCPEYGRCNEKECPLFKPEPARL